MRAPFASRSLCIAALVGAFAACSSSTPQPTPDAATEAAVMPDAAADTPPARPASDIYGPCRSTMECAAGLTCRTEAESGLSGGECNRTCMTDDDCVLQPSDGSAPVDGWCQPSVNGGPRLCARVCTNGIDCERSGYSCRTFNSGQLNQVRACVGICTAESCVDGNVCDLDANRCRPRNAPATGRTLGQSCLPSTRAGVMAPEAMRCRSDLCNPDWSPDSRGNRFYTGWNGGYCQSRCILPAGYNSSNFWGEMMLPQANCPQGGLCLAFSGSLARGDIGVCLKSCNSNADCRASEGYFCQKTVQLSASNTRRYSNGYCIPVNCANTATPCPTGLTCRMNANGTGSCIPPAMP